MRWIRRKINRAVKTILVSLLLGGCVNIDMGTCGGAEVTLTESSWPEQPTMTVKIKGDALPQKYYVDYDVNGKDTYAEWVFMECGMPEQFTIRCDGPQEIEVNLKIGINAGGSPYWIYRNKLSTICR